MWVAGLLLLLGGLAGCQRGSPVPPPTPQAPGETRQEPTSPTPTPALLPSPSPSPTPLPRQATICLGKEPASLFYYANSGAAGRAILAALYPEPYDPLNLNNSILENLPDLAAGEALLEPVAVQPGEPIVDAFGELNVLLPGVLYRPAGCDNPACALPYDGDQPATMAQWALRFRLRPGLRWSDGAPLGASDSHYAYELARALRPASKTALLERTAAYRALDEQTLEWRGLPGYSDPDMAGKFFTPLPRHAWADIDPMALAQSDVAARQPPGYGPFAVQSWQPGQGLRLVRNPYYWRLAEGLPQLDLLDFAFVVPGEPAVQALLAENGGCDLLDSSATQEELAPRYAELHASGQAQLVVQPAAWEALFFNVAPFEARLPVFFGQLPVRQSAALCIDRGAIAQQVFAGLALPAYGLDAGLSGEYRFDPTAGQALLEAAGWRDLDQDPATPRSAQGVPGVADGTVLAFDYLVSGEADRQLAAGIVQQGLAACGMAAEIVTQPAGQYLAPGPEGAVFGRRFSLAQLAWAVPAGQLPCELFSGNAVPGPYPQGQYDWGGANLSGYANPDYDLACQAARASLPGEAQAAAAEQAEALFARDLPALPLYWRPRWYLLRPGACGFSSAAPRQWPILQLEQLSAGEGC